MLALPQLQALSDNEVATLDYGRLSTVANLTAIANLLETTYPGWAHDLIAEPAHSQHKQEAAPATVYKFVLYLQNHIVANQAKAKHWRAVLKKLAYANK